MEVQYTNLGNLYEIGLEPGEHVVSVVSSQPSNFSFATQIENGKLAGTGIKDFISGSSTTNATFTVSGDVSDARINLYYATVGTSIRDVVYDIQYYYVADAPTHCLAYGRNGTIYSPNDVRSTFLEGVEVPFTGEYSTFEASDSNIFKHFVTSTGHLWNVWINGVNVTKYCTLGEHIMFPTPNSGSVLEIRFNASGKFYSVDSSGLQYGSAYIENAVSAYAQNKLSISKVTGPFTIDMNTVTDVNSNAPGLRTRYNASSSLERVTEPGYYYVYDGHMISGYNDIPPIIPAYNWAGTIKVPRKTTGAVYSLTEYVI